MIILRPRAARYTHARTFLSLSKGQAKVRVLMAVAFVFERSRMPGYVGGQERPDRAPVCACSRRINQIVQLFSRDPDLPGIDDSRRVAGITGVANKCGPPFKFWQGRLDATLRSLDALPVRYFSAERRRGRMAAQEQSSELL